MALQTLTRPIFWAPFFAMTILSYFFVDLRFSVFLNQVDQQHHWLTLIFNQVNHLGTSAPYLLLSGLGFLWARFVAKKRQLAAWLGYFFLAIFISGLAINTLKIICGRARPYEFFSYHIYGFYFFKRENNFWSFPSGHATAIAAIATTGYLLLKRFGWLFILLISLVCFGRVMCRAHYLSDVMVGAYIGFLVSFWLNHWLKENHQTRHVIPA